MIVEHILVYWIFSFWFAVSAPSLECIKSVLVNQLLVNPLLFYMCGFQEHDEPVSYMTIPATYFIEEFGFYWIHRTFHTVPWLYEHFHGTHHQWIRPEPYSALDCHPLEHALGNMFSLLLGPWLFGWSYTWVWRLVMLATISVVHGHRSDGVFANQQHALHHKHRNGNYGKEFFSDKLFGTFISSKA